MKKYLIPNEGIFYKANLHSHSTMSDGHLSPEEMKKEYQKRGYSILAITDHDYLRRHNELTEKNFLLLTGYEVGITSYGNDYPYAFKKIVDLLMIAKNPEERKHVGFHPETIEWLVKKGVLTESEAAEAEYVGELREIRYSNEIIKQTIKSANQNGYLVCINHPMYSLTNYTDYSLFKDALAVEVYNHSCNVIYGLSDSENVYEDMLRGGIKINCVATDDNHNTFDIDSYKNDSFGGFTMIKAKKLEYSHVIEALENRWFYASCGPEIKELYYENGRVYIKTSPVADICMVTLGRKGERMAKDDGETICEASFEVDAENCGYIRFRLTDKNGKKAWSNPYYANELEPSVKAKKRIW